MENLNLILPEIFISLSFTNVQEGSSLKLFLDNLEEIILLLLNVLLVELFNALLL